MNRLARTRSQHFVASPRRVGTPLKHKASLGRLHTTKRRRVVSGTGGNVNGNGSTRLSTEIVTVSDSEDEADLEVDGDGDETDQTSATTASHSDASKRSNGAPLDSQAGSQRANRRPVPRQVRGKAKPGGVITVLNDVFGDEGNISPRKRKRGSAATTPLQAASPGRSGSDTGDSGSWIEVDEGEHDQGEIIGESDHFHIKEASAHALHRLRKAELIRLCKVAGLRWQQDDPSSEADAAMEEESMDSGDDLEGAMSKNGLVDVLVNSRKPRFHPENAVRLISPLPSPRASPRRKGTLDSPPEIKRLRSGSSLAMRSASSSSSNLAPSGQDPDVTPKANIRARTGVRVRMAEATPMRIVPRRKERDGKSEKRRNGYRRKSTHEHAGPERRARFGDDVKSPAHGLLGRPRGVSSSSSTYVTTDTSPPAGPTRPTPRRLTRRRPSQPDIDAEEDEVNEEDDAPLGPRLRSRTASFQIPAPSEADADDEEDEIELFSPSKARSRRGSRKDLGRANSGDEMQVDGDGAEIRHGDMRSLQRRDSRQLPRRQARKKALAAIKAHGGDSTGSELEFADEVVEEPEEDEDMEVDDEPSNRSTRSQLRSAPHSPNASQGSKSTRRMSRRGSGRVVSSSGSDLTPAPPTLGMDIDDEVVEEDETSRTTRSGRAFGTIQSRSDRLRQEAMDDPDMEATDDEDEDDEAFEAGKSCHLSDNYDLTDATPSSLVRLLRDELVQLCEARGLEVGGTKPQLAKSLIEWRDEQRQPRSSSSTPTAKPSRASSNKSKKSDTLEHLHAVASHKHVAGDATPVLLRSHVHGHDPATPHASPKAVKNDLATAKPGKGSKESDTSKRSNNEAELNFDLAELGLEDSQIKPEHLTKLEKIGSGGFKDVYVGKLKGRQKVAISEFREHLSEMDIRELKLLAEFSHPNIVKFKGICIPEDSSQVPCMLVSELCENGDLFDYIRNVERPPIKRVLNLMLDIARGLEYLHTRKPAIIHRDCKSSNILINRAGQAKVGDFGLARVKHSTRSMIRSLVGTVNWQAPELWHPTPRYDYKVDVFSAGVVFWEMMSGWGTGEQKYPWEGHNEHYIYDAVGQKHRRPAIAGLVKIWGEEPVKLMQRMWEQDPAERPTMTDVVADLESIIAGI